MSQRGYSAVYIGRFATRADVSCISLFRTGGRRGRAVIAMTERIRLIALIGIATPRTPVRRVAARRASGRRCRCAVTVSERGRSIVRIGIAA